MTKINDENDINTVKILYMIIDTGAEVVHSELSNRIWLAENYFYQNIRDFSQDEIDVSKKKTEELEKYSNDMENAYNITKDILDLIKKTLDEDHYIPTALLETLTNQMKKLNRYRDEIYKKTSNYHLEMVERIKFLCS